MGERHFVYTRCAYCSEATGEVYYAPTCDVHTFTCEKCSMVNFIDHSFYPQKVERVTVDEIISGFLAASSFPDRHDKKELKKFAREDLRAWKKANAETKKKSDKGRNKRH